MIHAEYAAKRSGFGLLRRSAERIFLFFCVRKEEKEHDKKVIVVEGRDDTVAIRRAVEADTIETGALPLISAF